MKAHEFHAKLQELAEETAEKTKSADSNDIAYLIECALYKAVSLSDECY
jgi:hypothetical protein